MHPCPECKAAADLSGIALPPTGRLVSCGICGGIWRAFPLAPPAVAPEPAAAEEPAPLSAEAAPATETAAKPTGSAGSGFSWGRRAAAGLAAATISVGALVAVRDYLAVWVPSSRGTFALLGISSRPSEVAVELVGIAPLDGGTVFRVTYEIVNDTALSRPLPAVCATGRDTGAERLFLRCFPGDPKGIPSRGSKRFTFVAADLSAPLADLDLDLSFK